MAEHKDDMGIKDKIHIILTSPDGKVKDERKTEEVRDATNKRPRIQQ